MKRSKVLLMAAAAIALLLLGAAAGMQLDNAVSAQEDPPVAPLTLAGQTAALLQYQGRLSDPSSGEAVADGSYTMTLRLYSAASGGTALWTEVKDVAVTDGLFSTVLGSSKKLNQALFDGRALWLGIKVGADAEAKPRQQVLPVAYALGLLPGASVKANSGGAALSVSNKGSGQALYAGGPVEVDGDLTVEGKLVGGSHVHSGHNNDPKAHHTRYTDAEAASAAVGHPEIVTQYEFEDHIYGGMHSNRALAYGSINQFGEVASATWNVSSEWVKIGSTEYYEITIDGHTYDHRYVTTVTPIFGIANAWSMDGKLIVTIYSPDGQPVKRDFSFVTFQP